MWNCTSWKINDNCGGLWNDWTIIYKSIEEAFHFLTPVFWSILSSPSLSLSPLFQDCSDKQANRRALVVFDHNCVSLCRKLVQSSDIWERWQIRRNIDCSPSARSPSARTKQSSEEDCLQTCTRHPVNLILKKYTYLSFGFVFSCILYSAFCIFIFKYFVFSILQYFVLEPAGAAFLWWLSLDRQFGEKWKGCDDPLGGRIYLKYTILYYSIL